MAGSVLLQTNLAGAPISNTLEQFTTEQNNSMVDIFRSRGEDTHFKQRNSDRRKTFNSQTLKLGALEHDMK
jgi:hypothetical protein